MYIILGIIIFLVVWAIFIYNGLVSKKNQVDEAWSDIDVQLKRRYDLIRNLVETVKGYAAHEQETLQKVIEARAKAMGAQSMSEKAAAEDGMSTALKSIFALAESYPQLRAVESFTQLQGELSDTENKIQAARRFYNGNVRDYNTQLQVFPSNLFASAFGFKSREFFELTNESEKEPVSVKF